jgi:hypothetical protein
MCAPVSAPHAFRDNVSRQPPFHALVVSGARHFVFVGATHIVS